MITLNQLVRIYAFVLSGEPEKADAIVYLEGDGFARVSECVGLFKKGLAPLIVISGGDHRPRLECFAAAETAREFARRGVPRESLLLEDVSINTFDQAREVMRIVKERGLHSIILVTSPYHQVRAYLTFLKGMRDSGQLVRIVNAPARGLSWFRRTTRGTRNVLIQGEIRKINRYLKKGHLVDYKTFEEYERWKEER